MYTVDIDVGGTLTDGLFSDGKTVLPIKVDTTPHDLTVCFHDCLLEGARRLGFEDLALYLRQVRLIRWSTTITSNVLAERAGPKLGLLVGRGREQDLYTTDGASAALGSLVAEADVIGVAAPSDSKVVLQAVKALLESGVRRICVSLGGALQDPAQEQAIKATVQAQYPDHVLGAVPVLLGSDVSSYSDDMTRTHHALMNAYVHGPLAASLYKAEDDLRGEGFDHPLLIGHANGGVARVSKTKALDTLESGPAMGVLGAAHFARRYGLNRVLALDVGGTTIKASAIQDGRPVLAREAEIFGIPVRARAVLISSAALGGGSALSVAEGSRVVLGPESMGAYPGPACYDLGGTRATLTDAFLVLNWLNPDYFLGGSRRLKPELARPAIEQDVARPLGKGVEEAAAAAAEAAFETAAEVARHLLADVGWQPGEAVLAAFGGNGPIFACDVAGRAGIPRAYVFDLGAVLSTFGSSVSDVVHVYEHAVRLRLAEKADQQRVAAIVERMRAEAQRDMKGEGLDFGQVELVLELEAADRGSAAVPVTILLEGGAPDPAAVAEHAGGSTTELVRLRATYPMPSFEAGRRSPKAGGTPDEGKVRSEVVWPGQPGGARVHAWESLSPGQKVPGGTILESPMTTYLVPPGWTLAVDEMGNGELVRKE